MTLSPEITIDKLIIKEYIRKLEECLDPLALTKYINPVEIIRKEIIFDGGLRNEIFNVITNYIKKNLAVLEIITTTKKLGKERLVFNILRNNLERRHLKLTHSDINKLYLSYLFKN